MVEKFPRTYVLALLTGACLLVLEIAAGRLSAPIVGVSIFSWTSVIGIVLAGMSLGQYLGGLLADRAPSTRSLGILLFLSGLSCLGVLVLVDWTYEHSDLLFRLPAVPRIFGISALLYFLPSALIGSTAPMIVKLGLTRLEIAGGTVGRIYALSNLGSIAGVFLSGFVLISTFGSLWVVFGVGVALMLLAITAGELFRFRRTLAGLAVPLVALIALIQTTDAFESACTRETHYYCIYWSDNSQLVRGHTLRVMRLDQLDHGYTSVEDPDYLHYGYLKVFAEVTDHVARSRPNFRALFVGGGPYTLPRYLELEYPDAEIVVIEIDPEVTRVAREEFGLPEHTRVQSINADAREVARELVRAGNRYDIIYGDAFHGISVPYHLTTLEFAEMMHALLSDDGVYIMNVVDRLPDGRFLPSLMNTLKHAFPHVHLLSEGIPMQQRLRKSSTYVVAATLSPLNRTHLQDVRGRGARGAPITLFMSEADITSWMRSANAVLLTDDFVPTDQLLAPIVAER